MGLLEGLAAAPGGRVPRPRPPLGPVGLELAVVHPATEALLETPLDVTLEGVQGGVHAAAGCALVAVLLDLVPLGGHQDVLGCDGVPGVLAVPGFLGGPSGAGVLCGGRRRGAAPGRVLGKARSPLGEAVGLQVAAFVRADEVAVRGEPGPVDGAVPPQLLPVLRVSQDAVCRGKGCMSASGGWRPWGGADWQVGWCDTRLPPPPALRSWEPERAGRGRSLRRSALLLLAFPAGPRGSVGRHSPLVTRLWHLSGLPSLQTRFLCLL